MKERDLEFLKQLLDAPSPSGFEQPAAEVFRSRMTAAADTVGTDVMGSVHAVLRGKGAGVSVLLAGHIDEVGLMVKYITPEGFIAFTAIGGVDAAILPGTRVRLHTASGDLLGVLGRKPIHLIEADERKHVTKLEKLFIDLGLPAEEVRKRVRLGDPITYDAGFERLGTDLAVSRAFDDKMGVWIAARVLEEVREAGGAAGDLIAAATVQEEVGHRGGATSTYSLDPIVGIALDVDHATDYPDIDRRAHGDITCGGGPILARGPFINPVLFDLLVRAAENAGVPCQISAEAGRTGTDADDIQVSRGGKVTGLVSVALRYMHTPTEVLALRDLDAAVKLLTRFILDLDPATDFTPRVRRA